MLNTNKYTNKYTNKIKQNTIEINNINDINDISPPINNVNNVNNIYIPKSEHNNNKNLKVDNRVSEIIESFYGAGTLVTPNNNINSKLRDFDIMINTSG